MKPTTEHEYQILYTRIDRLKEKNSLLEWEVKNLRGFLKHLGYTEEEINKVSLFKGAK
jgi:FtsZ-binding cell division protein ZapB